jgi:hypothetical protein
LGDGSSYEGDWSQDKHDGKGIMKYATSVARKNRARNKRACGRKHERQNLELARAEWRLYLCSAGEEESLMGDGVKQAKVEGRGMRERAAELIDAGECMRNGGGMAEYHDSWYICPSRRGARS